MSTQFCHRLITPLFASLSLVLACAEARAGDPFYGIRRGPAGEPFGGGPAFEPVAAVGPDRIIQTGNWRIGCWTRDGATLLWKARTALREAAPAWTATKFWDGLSNAGWDDSKAIYDQFSGRFVVITLGAPTQELFVAVSKDSTPGNPYSGEAGAWDKFVTTINVVGNLQSGFDWPQLAVSEKWIWVTGKATTTQQGVRHVIVALRRPPPPPWIHDPSFYNDPQNKLVLIREAVGTQANLSYQWSLPAPTHFFGTMPTDTMYFVQYLGDPSGGTTARYRISALRLNPDATLADPDNIPTFEFNAGSSFVDVAQGFQQRCPAGAFLAYTPHYNVQNAVWREGKIYFARPSFVSDQYGGRWVASWHMVTTNGWPSGGAQPTVEFGIFDSGRVFDTKTLSETNYPVHYIYPYVMPTALGDVALFATRIVSTGFVDLVCTSHRASDPPGILGTPVSVIKASDAGHDNPLRWGDYEGIALDPNDEARVWVCGEVAHCPSPNQADEECPACIVTNPPAACTTVNCYSSAVGSYMVPGKPVRTLQLQRQATDPPPPLTVRIMPMDIYGSADATLNASAVQERKYGSGTVVTMLAAKGISDWSFSKWVVDGDAVSAPPGTEPRVLTLVLDQDHLVTPVYARE